MFYKLKNKAKKAWFDICCREIHHSSPITFDSDGVVIVSAVGNLDVTMYLVAIKSFFYNFKKGKVVLLVRNDCPEGNIAKLEYHLRPLRIIRDKDVGLGACRSGGTWERLALIAHEVKDNFVIQLDADTVTFNTIPEIIECVKNNCSFMIGEWPGQELEPMEQTSERVRLVKSNHVQILAERAMCSMPDYKSYSYARGQSSFAGFAKGAFSFEFLEAFSKAMEEAVGLPKWREWGSESVASNFVVANSPSASILPNPKYTSFYPGRHDYDLSSLVHFEGSNRFAGGVYVKKAKEMIRKVRAIPSDGQGAGNSE
jgi:hypothetical protein